MRSYPKPQSFHLASPIHPVYNSDLDLTSIYIVLLYINPAMSSLSPSPTTSQSLSAELADEITSINAIYGDVTLSLHTGLSPSSNTILLLNPPVSHPLHPTTLLLSFPSNYPFSPCIILGPGSVDASAAKGFGRQVAEIAQSALTEVAVAGEPCVFALLSELESQLATDDEAIADIQAESENERSGSPENAESTEDSVPDRFALWSWTIAEPIESHKSVFIARAIRVSSSKDVADATNALLQDKHVAKATHNIRAWRLRMSDGDNATMQRPAGQAREHQESDDDGEARAGARVLAIMNAMDVWNVLVVVSRWYGGVKLGPERFRIIGQAARDVLLRIGSEGQEKGGKKDDKGRKKGKA
jgi:Uncharacterized protein family UPF0029/RWD domain